ncbi:unnamed protein product, partial [marine sediment metagenome]
IRDRGNQEVGGEPSHYGACKKMLQRIKKYRPTTEQFIFLILYRYDGRENRLRLGISVKELQVELALEMGRERSTRHIRRLLLNLEQKGAIKRDFNYLQAGHSGHESQATRYIINDVAKGLDFFLTDQELQKREETLKKGKEGQSSLPGLFYKRSYKPSQAYIDNYAPFYKALKETPLQPKFPKGDPRNYERQKTVNMILNAKKKERASTLL